MTSKEALNTICLECQRSKGKIQVACPFRSISNEYCDEYEQIKKDLEVAEIIKNKNVFPLALMSLPYELYNGFAALKEQQITQEEYDKVKGWLKNE